MHKLKWFITWQGAATVLIVYWLFSAPTSAAAMAHKGFGVLSHAGHSAQTFLSHL